MAKHMSLRLAWHANGWNGHICDNPCGNVYCVGTHSYPGNVITETRDLEYEKKHSGEAMCSLDHCVACAFSANAFGDSVISAVSEPPSWWFKNHGKDVAKAAELVIQPYTACTWCYEGMYGDDVTATGNTARKYDNDARLEKAKQYFSQFEEGKSLVVYYSGFSNPFSTGEEQTYVIVGLSRIKQIGDFSYYTDCTDEIKERYANGIVWQKPITSNYPEEGLRIPYEKYMDDEDTLNRIMFKPDNNEPFKYGSREVSNDDAINIVWRLLEIVDVLIEINDTSDDWNYRKQWLNSLLNELWEARGPYPGLPSVLIELKLSSLVSEYIKITKKEDKQEFYSQIRELLLDRNDTVGSIKFDKQEQKRICREFQLREEDEQKLLLDILPRFELTEQQVSDIVSEQRQEFCITSGVDDIIANPYIIFELYVGIDGERIPFYKIDNGILPSPELAIKQLLDSDSPERLRALCVDELNKIASHSFGKISTILEFINKRLERMPDWMQATYKLRNFVVDKEILSEALQIRSDDKQDMYIYLKQVFEDERIIEENLRRLADLPDIQLTTPISQESFKKKLIQNNSILLEIAKDKYDEILDSQADLCMKIFCKPISVISGAAGTGKTTVLKSIIENIKRVHGKYTNILIMAPTGKATERIKKQTGEPSTTIHSFLAKEGWINDNMTFKRAGGSQSSNVSTIIIDECSMIDLNVFATLVRAINWNSVQRLILVGDPNQLPPIGRGRVFADVIDWLREEYPDNISVLKMNIRQLVNTVSNNGNGILDIASIFIQEQQKENEELSLKKEKILREVQESGEIDKDLSVYYWKDQEELNSELHDIIVEDMEKETGKTCDELGGENKLWIDFLRDKDNKAQPEKTQVISPYRGEFYGTDEINRFMQHTFNGSWSKRCNIDGLGVFDKVIQFRNRPKSDPASAYVIVNSQNESKEIFNGEIGTVRLHGLDAKNWKWISWIERFQVEFAGTTRKDCWYNYGKKLGRDENGRWIPEQKPLDNLELAYAVSVHKSQGSEFDYVYIILPNRDSHLLSMELLYTAITRAQKHVTIFIQDNVGTLAKMCRLEKSAVRRINSSVFKFDPLPEDFLYFSHWYESGKKLATLTKYLVRSKSEVIIANLLFGEGIPFYYEEPLFAPDGTMYLPDFTVTFRGETYYWEHVGLVNNEKYMNHWKKKEQWYKKNFPGKLITTFESSNLSNDAMDIITRYR